jgi:predicted RNA polymerase sigma factor
VHGEAGRGGGHRLGAGRGALPGAATVAPGPVVTLNRAVAVGTTDGPQAGLDLLATLDGDPRIAASHRLLAVRAHLLAMAGNRDGAREAYAEAARRATSVPEQRYLEERAPSPEWTKQRVLRNSGGWVHLP